MEVQLAWNLLHLPLLTLPGAGIKGTYHHAWPFISSHLELKVYRASHSQVPVDPIERKTKAIGLFQANDSRLNYAIKVRSYIRNKNKNKTLKS